MKRFVLFTLFLGALEACNPVHFAKIDPNNLKVPYLKLKEPNKFYETEGGYQVRKKFINGKTHFVVQYIKSWDNEDRTDEKRLEIKRTVAKKAITLCFYHLAKMAVESGFPYFAIYQTDFYLDLSKPFDPENAVVELELLDKERKEYAFRRLDDFTIFDAIIVTRNFRTREEYEKDVFPESDKPFDHHLYESQKVVDSLKEKFEQTITS